MNFNKNQILNIIGIIISLFIVIGILRVAFWELNIFKKETELPQNVVEIEKELKYIDSLDFDKITQRVSNSIPSIVKPLEIPTINQDEIGKNNLFE